MAWFHYDYFAENGGLTTIRLVVASRLAEFAQRTRANRPLVVLENQNGSDGWLPLIIVG